MYAKCEDETLIGACERSVTISIIEDIALHKPGNNFSQTCSSTMKLNK